MEGLELQKIVANFVSHRWRHGVQKGLDSSLRWLPVIKINEDIWYGLSEHGRWVAGAENKNVRLVELSTEGCAVPLLPCLEHPRSEIESLIISSLKSLGLPETVAQTFPFEAAVICGLTSSSDYWIELALEWQKNTPLNDAIAQVLSSVAKSKGVSQKNRHRAAKFLTEWRKAPDLRVRGVTW